MSYIPRTFEIPKGSNTKISSDFIVDASAGTIQFNDQGYIRLLYGVNVTDNIIVYNPTVNGLGGNSYSNQINFDYDTTTMEDSDEWIFVIEIKEVKEDEVLLREMIELQRETNKLLRKIYN